MYSLSLDVSKLSRFQIRKNNDPMTRVFSGTYRVNVKL